MKISPLKKRVFISKPRKRQGRSRKGEGSLKLRGNVWWYIIADPRRPGTKIEKSCETGDYEAALKKKNEEIARFSRPGAPGRPMTFSELLTEYGTYIERYKQRSFRSIRTAIKHLSAAFGPLKVDSLTTADTDQFRDDRMAEDEVSDSTVNRELGYLRAAMKREMKTTPPRVTHIPHMRLPSEKDCVREGFVERPDYEKILACLDPALKAIFVCAFHTGARSGELKMIQWSQVNWDKNIIELRPKTTKNQEGRHIPIWGDMREHLERQKRLRDQECPGCPWVFFWPDGYHHRAVPGERLRDFRFGWKEACDKAGYPDLLFHDLRRSAIRYADLDAGISTKLVMKMSGHKTMAVYDRYNISTGKDMIKVGRDLDTYLATKQRAS